MRRPFIAIISILLVALLILPGVAIAKSGNGRGSGKSASVAGQAKPGKGRPAVAGSTEKAAVADEDAEQPKTDKAEKAAAKAAAKAEKAAARQERKVEKAAAKEARKAAKTLERQARKSAAVAAAAEETTDSAEPTETTEPTRTPGPGITNAFSRIGANLEKSLAKIAAGKKTQLPPGLVRVWMKFAEWLGIDPATRPGYEPDSEGPTSTVEPSSTVEPTQTIEPTDTAGPPPAQDPPSSVDQVEPSVPGE